MIIKRSLNVQLLVKGQVSNIKNLHSHYKFLNNVNGIMLRAYKIRKFVTVEYNFNYILKKQEHTKREPND